MKRRAAIDTIRDVTEKTRQLASRQIIERMDRLIAAYPRICRD